MDHIPKQDTYNWDILMRLTQERNVSNLEYIHVSRFDIEKRIPIPAKLTKDARNGMYHIPITVTRSTMDNWIVLTVVYSDDQTQRGLITVAHWCDAKGATLNVSVRVGRSSVRVDQIAGRSTMLRIRRKRLGSRVPSQHCRIQTLHQYKQKPV